MLNVLTFSSSHFFVFPLHGTDTGWRQGGNSDNQSCRAGVVCLLPDVSSVAGEERAGGKCSPKL